MKRLQDKVVLITGSTGIAAAAAELAAHEGAHVFISSRTAANCEALVETIANSGGSSACLSADLRDPDSVIAMIEACVATFGRLDAVYNVAGISGRRFGDGPLHECTEEGWDVTLDTNVKSMFFVCKEALLQMLMQEVSESGLRGSILNMASVLGFSPEPTHFASHAYAASKGAIIGMSKSMAAYYAPHKIRVNVIAPSLIRTPMSKRAQENPLILEFMKHKQPLAEDMIPAADIANASIFLLSDEARYITGDVVTVDAGWCVSA